MTTKYGIDASQLEQSHEHNKFDRETNKKMCNDKPETVFLCTRLHPQSKRTTSISLPLISLP